MSFFENIFSLQSGGDAVPGALSYAELGQRLLAAVALSFALAARPWRWVLRKPLPKIEMVQAQVLLCCAAAVITVVIGDSVAKAFGLVGLGGFVRFRSGLKDPRDAAILFLMIGLGMACGHGSIRLALVGAGFVAFLLLAIDLLPSSGVSEGETEGEEKASKVKAVKVKEELA